MSPPSSGRQTLLFSATIPQPLGFAWLRNFPSPRLREAARRQRVSAPIFLSLLWSDGLVTRPSIDAANNELRKGTKIVNLQGQQIVFESNHLELEVHHVGRIAPRLKGRSETCARRFCGQRIFECTMCLCRRAMTRDCKASLSVFSCLQLQANRASHDRSLRGGRAVTVDSRTGFYLCGHASSWAHDRFRASDKK